MVMSWPSLLRTARRMVRLTQEDFAADLGRSQSTVALWETGRRPVPPAVRRRVLDILAGYYHRQPTYGTLVARAAAALNPVTLYRQGMIVQAANPAMLGIWRKRGLDLVGAPIIPLYRTNLRAFEVAESHILPMLDGTSQVLSVSFYDRSLMDPQFVIRRTATVHTVGEGRLVALADCFIHEAPGTDLPVADLRIVTRDDVSDAAADGTPLVPDGRDLATAWPGMGA
ncbi:helix-turn-helix domain-containing protein [Azospirillum sp.]|uniref:helix-turn-helix domain-containing protein n=1 Tax=Azospirillum sp. TaxID=34012 RepID=UPI002D23C8EF|nr:helix-turn-helix domain-containing protein [Azospirillum sp.]HYD64482.1 helix-turn-helix domain-containing protein [Azospirillum sp.]